MISEHMPMELNIHETEKQTATQETA